MRKNCSSDHEKLLKFEVEGQDFANFLRSLEQYLFLISWKEFVLKSGKTENQEPRITSKPTQYRKIISPKE